MKMNQSMRLSKDNFKPFQTSSTDINERFDPISRYHLFYYTYSKINFENSKQKRIVPVFVSTIGSKDGARRGTDSDQISPPLPLLSVRLERKI